MENNIPFIYRFKTDNQYYIYDVNSNRILLVDKITYDLLGEYGTLSNDDIKKKYAPVIDPTLLQETLNNIKKKIENDNVFCSQKPKDIQIYSSKNQVQEQLQSELKRLILNITEQCNMRCSYCIYSGCYPNERQHTEKTMSFEIAKKATDFFLAHSLKSENRFIQFYGGEPLLNFQVIKQITEYTKNQKGSENIRFGISTNGLLLDDDRLSFLIKHRFSLCITLNGSEEIHDRYRKTANNEKSFQTIIQNLKKIKQTNEEYYVNAISFSVTLVPPWDLEKIETFFSTFELNNYWDYNITFVDTNDTFLLDTLQVDQKQMNEKLKNDILSLKKKYLKTLTENLPDNKFLSSFFLPHLEIILKRELLPLETLVVPNAVCIPGLARLFVGTEGKLYMCEKIGEHFCIGDVEKGFDFDTIFKLLDTIKTIMQEQCLSCWAFRLCSMCYIGLRKGDTLDKERMNELCKKMRETTGNYLQFYASIREKKPDAFMTQKRHI